MQASTLTVHEDAASPLRLPAGSRCLAGHLMRCSVLHMGQTLSVTADSRKMHGSACGRRHHRASMWGACAPGLGALKQRQLGAGQLPWPDQAFLTHRKLGRHRAGSCLWPIWLSWSTGSWGAQGRELPVARFGIPEAEEAGEAQSWQLLVAKFGCVEAQEAGAGAVCGKSWQC